MTDPADLAYLPLHELSRRLARRDLSPVEVTRALLERTERLEPRLNAYITLTPDGALADARRAEAEIARGERRGPLHGVPIAVKDLFWTKGVRTTAGSRSLDDFVPAEDSTVVAKLRAAGAVILGKTNMPEYAWGPMNEYAYGVTHNPWRLDRFTGGSSMGAGAALAAGLAPGALGSDTGGSIRSPAAWSGVTGLKPTYGRISLFGVVPLALGLDHAGPMARSALDCAIILDAISGHDPRDPGTVDAPPTDSAGRLGRVWSNGRIGVVRSLFAGTDPEVAAAVEASFDVFRRLGWTVEDVDLPHAVAAGDANVAMLRAEAWYEYGRLFRERPESLLPQFRQKMEEASTVTSDEVVAAKRVGVAFRAELHDAFKRFDILATPARPVTARPMDDSGRMLETLPVSSVNSAFNIVSLPALSVPCGFDSAGLPIGLQLLAPPLGDAEALLAGHTYQSATDWHTRRPALD